MKRRLLMVILIITILTSVAYADVDDLNNKLDKLYDEVIITQNGAKIYTNDIIYKIDTYNHEILKELEGFRGNNMGIKYPLVSEIEHFGILSDYSAYYDSSMFIEDQIKNPDIDFFSKMVEENFIDDLDLFIRGVEAIDIDLRGLEIIFNPYQVYERDSLGYFIDYTKSPDIIRSRIYMNESYDNIDYLSTFYHELGHYIYSNYVEKDKDRFDKYYNLYKKEFDSKKGVLGPEVPWQDRLTENFAEDFKYYITKKVIKDDVIKEHVNKNKINFYEKWTSYPYSEGLDGYFDWLLEGLNKKHHRYLPDIELSMEDYSTNFNLRDESYLNDFINKFVTKGDKIKINFNFVDESYLKPYKVNIYNLKGNKIYSKDVEDFINISLKKGTFKIEIIFQNGGMVDSIIYYIDKI